MSDAPRTEEQRIVLSPDVFGRECGRDLNRVKRSLCSSPFGVHERGDHWEGLGDPQAARAFLDDVAVDVARGTVTAETVRVWLGILGRFPHYALERRRRDWWSLVVVEFDEGSTVGPVQIAPPRTSAVAIDGGLAVPVPVLFAGFGSFVVAAGMVRAVRQVGIEVAPNLSFNVLVLAVVLTMLVAVLRCRTRNRGHDEIRSAAPDLVLHPPYAQSLRSSRLYASGQAPGARGSTATSEPDDDICALWAATIQRHNELRHRFGRYETDPREFFHRPLLADRTHPAVQRFYTAFAAADALRLDDHVPTRWEYVEDFANKVATAINAWEQAYTLAGEVGDQSLTQEQRNLLRKASSLIATALDDQAAASERTTAYERVLKLFGRAQIRPPRSVTDSLRREVERAVRPSLPPA